MARSPVQFCCSDNSIVMDFFRSSSEPAAVETAEDQYFIINIHDANIWISVLTIIFNPFFWNLVARFEHRTRILSDAMGSKHVACSILAAIIFLLGLYRDYRFKLAMEHQERWSVLEDNVVLSVGYCLLTLGMVFVLSSFWALGFFGTFLGDYFGIRKAEKVTSFPYNIFNNPMYIGSTLGFVGTALLQASQAGLALSALIGLCYTIAAVCEGSYMTKMNKDWKEKIKGN